ncbi:hypothetical protein [Nocardia sp. NPDC057227]|uniref:hypothetical protein n=1 Tax=Nocardia sp. NPDC057227 TaxID=3346056 RepID=UPI0036433401
MNSTTLRTGLFACAIAGTLVTGLTGCGDDEPATTASTTSATTTAAAGTAAGGGDPTAEVTKAYVGFFDAATPTDVKATLLENGDKFTDALAARAQSPSASSTTVQVSAVRKTDPTHAAVTYTILLGGNPVLPDQAGEAVQQNGTWKLAQTTYCALATMQGPLPPACSSVTPR